MPCSAVKGADVFHLDTMAAFSLSTIGANLDRFFATNHPAAKGENKSPNRKKTRGADGSQTSSVASPSSQDELSQWVTNGIGKTIEAFATAVENRIAPIEADVKEVKEKLETQEATNLATKTDTDCAVAALKLQVDLLNAAIEDVRGKSSAEAVKRELEE